MNVFNEHVRAVPFKSMKDLGVWGQKSLALMAQTVNVFENIMILRKE